MSEEDREQEGRGKSGIRIVDRRRFDSSGDEKVEGQTSKSPESKQAEKQEIKAESNVMKDQPPAGNFTLKDSEEAYQSEEQSDISFGSFVLSLATQALMQLGQLKAPDGITIPVDPTSAKQTIDILGVLQVKTKGNLDMQEENLLRDALHSLRLAYLKFR